MWVSRFNENFFKTFFRIIVVSLYQSVHLEKNMSKFLNSTCVRKTLKRLRYSLLAIYST